ncbi:hypothetical protein [Comamonas testosteroni]|uniref:hypothetical protein n=1 Tax=Comamonas testosteroni TaxID=285 RepID=UPI0028EA5287|nr:hypothetical protein [Comamonas testosteroni]
MNINDANGPAAKRDYIGLAGIVIGALGTAVTIIFSIKHGSDWKDFALIGSGWTAALMFAIFLWRASRLIEDNFNKIGSLTERVKSLEEKLTRSHEISHYLATVNKTPNATPRAAVAAAVEVDNP